MDVDEHYLEVEEDVVSDCENKTSVIDPPVLSVQDNLASAPVVDEEVVDSSRRQIQDVHGYSEAEAAEIRETIEGDTAYSSGEASQEEHQVTKQLSTGVPVRCARKSASARKPGTRRKSRLLSLIPNLDRAGVTRPGSPHPTEVHGHGAHVRWSHPESRSTLEYVVEHRVLGARGPWEATLGVKGKGGGEVDVKLPHAASSYVRVRVMIEGKRGPISRTTLITTDGLDIAKDRGIPPWQIIRDRMKKKKPKAIMSGLPSLNVMEVAPDDPIERAASAPAVILEAEPEPPSTPPSPVPDTPPPPTPPPNECICEDNALMQCEESSGDDPGEINFAALPYNVLSRILSENVLRARDLYVVSASCKRFRRCAWCQQNGSANGCKHVLEAAAAARVKYLTSLLGLGPITPKAAEGGRGESWLEVLRFTERVVLSWEERAVQLMDTNEDSLLLATMSGDMYSCGSNQMGTSGHGDDVARSGPELVHALKGGSRMVRAVSCGKDFCLVLTQSCEVISWGNNDHGQLGHGDKLTRFTPAPVRKLQHTGIVQLSAGDSHAAGLTSLGDLYTWGWDLYGNLGLGQGGLPYRKAPVLVETPFFQAAKPHQVSAGGQHTVVVTEGGAVLTWGRGACQRLGLGHVDITDHHKPQPVMALRDVRICQVAAGAGHTLALTVDGDVYSWGQDMCGELGRGNPVKEQVDDEEGEQVMEDGAGAAERSLEPGVALLQRRVVRISAGASTSVAVTAKGAVYAWGSNTCGELGVGDRKSRNMPCVVTGVEWGDLPPVGGSPVRQPPKRRLVELGSVTGGEEAEATMESGGEMSNGSGGDEQEPAVMSESTTVAATKSDVEACRQEMIDACAGVGRLIMVSAKGDVFSCGSNEGGGLGHGSSKPKHKTLPGVVHSLRGRWAELQYIITHGHAADSVSSANSNGANSGSGGRRASSFMRGSGASNDPVGGRIGGSHRNSIV